MQPSAKVYEFERIVQWMRELQRGGFYGTISLGWQNGHMTTVEYKSVTRPGEPLPIVPLKGGPSNV